MSQRILSMIDMCHPSCFGGARHSVYEGGNGEHRWIKPAYTHKTDFRPSVARTDRHHQVCVGRAFPHDIGTTILLVRRIRIQQRGGYDNHPVGEARGPPAHFTSRFYRKPRDQQLKCQYGTHLPYSISAAACVATFHCWMRVPRT